jgi:VanZ family protein
MGVANARAAFPLVPGPAKSGSGYHCMNVERRMSQWLRFFAWLSVVGLAVASWTPGEHMIRTGVRGSFEHIAAYLISTMLWVSAFPRTSPWMIGSALAVYAGILELGQIYVPGRHSQLEDFAASCAGVVMVAVPSLWIRQTSSSMRR